jgi:hypothetical protein
MNHTTLGAARLRRLTAAVVFARLEPILLAVTAAALIAGGIAWLTCPPSSPRWDGCWPPCDADKSSPASPGPPGSAWSSATAAHWRTSAVLAPSCSTRPAPSPAVAPASSTSPPPPA